MWWRSNLYDRGELGTAFRLAGFRHFEFAEFPSEASHLAVWGHIVIARP
jgi:hypothetical protein